MIERVIEESRFFRIWPVTNIEELAGEPRRIL